MRIYYKNTLSLQIVCMAGLFFIAFFVCAAACSSKPEKKFLPRPPENAVPAVELPSEPELTEWHGDVPHLFFHSMITLPELAFSDHALASFLRDWYVTKNEFAQILEQLYERNYILVDIYDTLEYVSDNGVRSARSKAPFVPEGKTPLVLSVDDLNYYEQTVEHGGASGLFVDAAGVLACTYKDAAGISRVSYDSEIVLALERFIEAHPDFAMPKARGIIALTAYNGFLGWKTNFVDNPALAADTEQAKAVADTLKTMGWRFACHSWGHLNPKSMSAASYERAEKRWIREAEPIIGKTDLFVFPFGAVPFKDPEKMPILRKLGYTTFFTVERDCRSYMHGDALIINRIEMDGIVLRYKAPFIKSFVDPEAIRMDAIHGK